MEEEALRQVAAQRAEQLRLLGRLDALGRRAQAQRVGERDDALDERARLRLAAEAGDQRAVDLDLVDGKALQRAQR